jgi:hypothetical protein
MWTEDSSTLPEQEEGRRIKILLSRRESDENGLFAFVLIKAFPSFTAILKKELTVSSCFRTYVPFGAILREIPLREAPPCGRGASLNPFSLGFLLSLGQ